MSTQRRPHFLRWIILGLIALACLFAGSLVVRVYLLRQVDQFSVLQQGSAEITKTPVVTALPLSGLLSPQWFHQIQNYRTEFASQLGGIANRLGVPLPPTQVSALDTALGNRVLIQWSTPLGQRYDGVEIYRDTNEQMSEARAITTDRLSAQGYYFDTNVENDTVYYYQLRSYRSGDGNDPVYSDWSDVISVIPTDHTPPAPPVMLSVTSLNQTDVEKKVDAGLLITWQPSTSSDVTTYRIYRSSEVGRLGQVLDDVAADVTAARDTDLTAGVTYYYTVTALDGADNESTTTVLAGSYGHSNPFVTSTSSTETNSNTNNGN